MCVQNRLVAKVQSSRIVPSPGYQNEEAMLDSIVKSCDLKQTLIQTGNYVVREGPNIESGDSRLLGEGMLMTIEFCARIYKRCVDAGVWPPAVLLVPNDIAPETFQSLAEERAFKKGYEIPVEVRALLAAAGMTSKPTYFFNRDFRRTEKETAREFNGIRNRIAAGGTAKLIVIFESFAQNLAAKALRTGRVKHAEDIQSEPSGRRRAIVPSSIVDTFSRRPQLSPQAVTITNPNGAPYCSFLAATVFREFERLGFENMISTMVKEEYPCLDKAAASYKYHFEGKMSIRNIYLDGASVFADSTIA